MPSFTDQFTALENVSDTKQAESLSTADDKAKILNNKSQEKQAQHGGSTITLDPLQTLQQEANRLKEQELRDFQISRTPETLTEAAIRGVYGGTVGTAKGAFYGLSAGAGAVLETATDGAVGSALKEFGVEGYQDFQQDMAKDARPEDSFLHSYEQAKNGDIGAMLKWAAHGTGYVGAQLATMLAGAGIIAQGTKALGQGAVKQVMGGLVRKEANRIAAADLASSGVKATAEQITAHATKDGILKAATANVTERIGQHIGMGAMGFGLEGGEIGADLAGQSVERGTPLTGAEVGRGLTATALAGGVEYLETLLGFKAVKGQLGKLPGTKNVTGVKGRVARAGATAGKVAPAEAAQEYIQTGIEQWGGYHDLMSDESKAERVDAAALGALGGGPTALAASVHGSPQEQKDKAERKEAKKLVNASAQHGYKEKVAAAVEKKDASEMFDPEGKNYNPIAGVEATKNIVQNEDTDIETKIASKDKAYAAYEQVGELLDAVIKQKDTVKADESLSQKEKDAQVKKLVERGKTLIDLQAAMEPVLDSMETAKTDSKEAIEKLKTAVKESNIKDVEATILEIYGSHGRVALDEETLQSMESNPEFSSKYKTTIESAKADNALTEHNELHPRKGSDEVHSDVISGGKGFKGKNQYLSDITTLVRKGKTKEALKQVEALESFTEQKVTRASTFDKFMEVSKQYGKSITTPADIKAANAHAKENGLDLFISKADADRMANYNTKRKGPGSYSIGPGVFENTITKMKLEADVLATGLTEAKRIAGIQEATTVPTQEKVTTKSQDSQSTVKKAAEKVDFKASSNEGQKQSISEASNKPNTVTPIKGQKAAEQPSVKSNSDQKTEKKQNTSKPTKQTKKEDRTFFRAAGLSNKRIDKLTPEQETKLLEVRSWSAEKLQSAISKSTPNSVRAMVLKKALADKPVAEDTKAGEEPVVDEATETEIKKEPVAEDTDLDEANRAMADAFNEEQEPDLSEYEDTNTEQEAEPFSFGETHTAPETLSKRITKSEKPANKTREEFLKNTPHYEINQLTEHATAKAISEGKFLPIQQTKNALEFLRDIALVRRMPVFNRKNQFTTDTKNMVDSLANFMEAFQGALTKTFKPKTEKQKIHRFEDPIQYLVQEYKYLPENVIHALSTVGYKWIATRGNDSIYNDDRAIRGMLKISDKNQTISQEGQELTRTLGVNHDVLKDSLGQEVFDLLGIKLKKTADADLKDTLISSLGLQVISSLQYMGHLESTEVNPQAFEDLIKQQEDPFNLDYQHVKARFKYKEPSSDQLKHMKKQEAWLRKKGYFGAKEDITVEKLTNTGFFSNVPTTHQQVMQNLLASKEGMRKYVFYRIATEKNKKTGLDQATSKLYGTVIQPYKKSPHTWDLVLKGERDKQLYSFEPFPYTEGEKARLKKTMGFEATEKETKNLSIYENRSWEPDAPTMNTFLFLGPTLQRESLGYVDESKQSINQIETAKGINLGIKKNLERLADWMYDATKQPDGYQSKFYIKNEFWRQMRMGQSGPVSPQGQKPDRSLFKLTEWTKAADLSNQDNHDLIMLGIGQALGQDLMKIGSATETKKRTEKLLQTDVMQEGIKALQQLQSEADFNTLSPEGMADLHAKYPDAAKAIVAAVKVGGEKAASLKALVEYARYQTAMEAFKADKTKSTFDTSVVFEVDGITNGPTINRLHFWMGDNVLDQLAALQGSGFRFHPLEAGQAYEFSEYIAKPTNHDAYQTTAFLMAMDLIIKEQALNEKRTDKHEKLKVKRAVSNDIKRIHAINSLIGKLIDPDTGNVTKEGRKLNKGGTMKVGYGMGETAQKRDLTNTVITAIEEQLTNIALLRDPEARKKFNEMMKVLSWKHWNNLGQMTTKELLQVELTPEVKADIAKHLGYNAGASQVAAVDNAFGSFKDASSAMNDGLSLAVVLYNTARKVFINQRKQELKAIKQEKGVHKNRELPLTIQDMMDIENRLRDMFPQIKTANGGRMPITKMSTSRDYTSKRTVTQTYNPKTVSQKIGFIKEQAKLEDPGVGGVVLAVQHLDAAEANDTMGKLPILNTHDGSTINALQAPELGVHQNDYFYKLHRGYHIPKAMNDTIQVVYKNFQNKMKEYTDEPLDMLIYDEMIQQFIGQTLDEANSTKNNPVFMPIEMDEVQAKVDEILAQAKEVARVTEQNKLRLLDAVQGVSQFGALKGEAKTGNKPVTDIDGVPVDKITEMKTAEIQAEAANAKSIRDSLDQDYTNASKLSEFITEVYKNKYGSTPNNKMSVDPTEYAYQREISGMNALQVYEQIKNEGTVQVDPEHDTHLKRLLSDLVQRVLQPVDVHLKTNPEAETHGQFAHVKGGKDRIFISSQEPIIGPLTAKLSHGIRMSTGEVYVHEMLHAILHTGLKLNNRLSAQVERLYNIAAEQLDYKAFLNDPTIDVKDPANRFEVKAAQARYDYLFVNPKVTIKTEFVKTDKTAEGTDPSTKVKRFKEQSNALDEFMTYGLSNKNFRDALSLIETTGPKYSKGWWKDLKGNNIQEMLTNIGQAIMDFFYYKFTSRPDNSNMATELEALAVKLSKIDSKHKSMLFTGIAKINRAYNAFGVLANKTIKKAFTNAPVLKSAHHLKVLGQQVSESDGALGQQWRDARKWWHDLNYGFVKSVATEVQGETPRMAWIHELLNAKKVYVDQAKNNAIAAKQKAAVAAFTKLVDEKGNVRPPTHEESVALTKVLLQADLSALTDTMTVDELGKLAVDGDALQKRVDAVLQEIIDNPALAPYLTYYKRFADAQGHFMIHKRGRQDEIVYQNTRVIAELRETKHAGKLDDKDVNRAIEILDRLASLNALQYAPQKQRAVFAGLIKKDPDAIQEILSMHSLLKEDAKKLLFNKTDYQYIKGYTKELFSPYIELAYGTKSAEAEMRQNGYHISAEPIPRDRLDPTGKEPIYVYTRRMGQGNNWVSMTLSTTRNRKKGVDERDIGRQLDLTTAQGIANNDAVIKDKQTIIDNMGKANFVPSLKDGNFMQPLFDSNGKLKSYRYMMATNTMDTYLEQNNEFDAILGAMAGQLVDKVKSPVMNDDLIIGLKAMADAEYNKTPENYVEVSPYSTDPELRDIYYMIPPKNRKFIKDIWGEHKMMVAKDVLAIAFGYRKYDITQAFMKDPADRAKIEKLVVGLSTMIAKSLPKSVIDTTGIEVAHNVETLMKFLTSTAKSNIVVKMVGLTLNNLGSNFIYLKSRGVPVGMIVKHGWEAYSYGLKYQADMQRLDQLEIKNKTMEKRGVSKQSAERIKVIREMTQIKHRISLNPTKITIESGLMPSLVDDIETAVGGASFPGPIEKAITNQTEKLPEMVQNVGKVMLMTQDTQLYKLANNGVKMSDFIGRHILYKYYTTAKGKDHKTHQEAVAAVMHEFVNFNLPTHRMTDYFNEIGFLWFTRYALRIQKIMVQAVIDKPFEVMMSLLLSAELGWDNINYSNAFVADPTYKFDNPFGAAMGAVDEPLTINAVSKVFK